MAEARPGCTTPIPESILTPDRASTRIGELESFDGLPTPEKAEPVHDQLTFIRGVEAFPDGVDTCSIEAMRRGTAEMGSVASHRCVIIDELLDSGPLFSRATPTTSNAKRHRREGIENDRHTSGRARPG